MADAHVIPTLQTPVPEQDHIYDYVTVSNTSGDIVMTNNTAYGQITGERNINSLNKNIYKYKYLHF